MKKTHEELRNLVLCCLESSFPSIAPQSDTELLPFLPENQFAIRGILGSIIEDNNQDFWIRYAAAHYMLEFFADDFYIKHILVQTLKRTIASKSSRLKSLIGLPVVSNSVTETSEELLHDIALITRLSDNQVKNWGWANEKLTCSIGNAKLF